MPTELLYLDHAYQKECTSKVLSVDFTDLTVDKTILFPAGYGQPNDKGHAVIGNREYQIVDVWTDGESVHLISLDTYPQDITGKEIRQVVDWNSRYLHMRFRSAMFLIASVAHKLFGSQARINQTYDSEAWMDLYVNNLSEDMISEIGLEANRLVREGVPIETIYLDEAYIAENSGILRIIRESLPGGGKLRATKIGNFLPIPDMGLHVKNTSDIGPITIKTGKEKGKVSNRIMLYLTD